MPSRANTTSRRIESRLTREDDRIRSFRRLLLAWFRRSRRDFPWRSTRATRYVEVVSELLLQRTRAETVAAFFPKFIQRFPNWTALAQATEEELRVFLEPIGLWRRRSASLRALANEMQARGGRFPARRDELESLPGVGQYIANATMVFCHGCREPLLDVNMARVLERCFAPRIHAQHAPGRFATATHHIAPEKRSGVERGAAWWLKKAAAIGPESARWAETLIEQRGIHAIRAVMGLVSLTQRHRDAEIEQACRVAHSHAAWRLRDVRNLLKRQDPPQQERFEFTTEHPLIRSLSDYGRLVHCAFQEVHA